MKLHEIARALESLENLGLELEWIKQEGEKVIFDIEVKTLLYGQSSITHLKGADSIELRTAVVSYIEERIFTLTASLVAAGIDFEAIEKFSRSQK